MIKTLGPKVVETECDLNDPLHGLVVKHESLVALIIESVVPHSGRLAVC